MGEGEVDDGLEGFCGVALVLVFFAYEVADVGSLVLWGAAEFDVAD